MSITVESYLSGSEVLRSRQRHYAEGEVVYFVKNNSDQDGAPKVTKATIRSEGYQHSLERFEFALVVWDDAKVEPAEDDACYVIRAPYSVLTEVEVLNAIARAGGLFRADSARTVDELVMNPTGNKELAPILSDRLAEKREF